MAKPLLDNRLWERIEPLLPVKKRRSRYPGRKPLSNRAVLTGILFVLKTGMPWEYLPREMGWGSGMTCWRRLRVRYERRPEIHDAFAKIACILICWNFLLNSSC
jgi:transposase